MAISSRACEAIRPPCPTRPAQYRPKTRSGLAGEGAEFAKMLPKSALPNSPAQDPPTGLPLGTIPKTLLSATRRRRSRNRTRRNPCSLRAPSQVVRCRGGFVALHGLIAHQELSSSMKKLGSKILRWFAQRRDLVELHILLPLSNSFATNAGAADMELKQMGLITGCFC